jgi:hypothetical protein
LARSCWDLFINVQYLYFKFVWATHFESHQCSTFIILGATPRRLSMTTKTPKRSLDSRDHATNGGTTTSIHRAVIGPQSPHASMSGNVVCQYFLPTGRENAHSIAFGEFVSPRDERMYSTHIGIPETGRTYYLPTFQPTSPQTHTYTSSACIHPSSMTHRYSTDGH